MPYTVKQVSALTGIGPDRLRAWERRYGVVSPARSESRYRLYDDADLARLRMMVQLVEAGAPASLAAEQVRAAHAGSEVDTGTDANTAAGASTAGGRDAQGAARQVLPSESAVPPLEALVSPAGSLDGGELDRLLDRAFAAGSFESVVEHWLLPALTELGEAWADGRIDVAGEHFVSGAVQARLGQAFEAAGTALEGPVVLVGLPPGSRHALGSLSFATCLRRLGADVRWLGSDLPVDSWAHAVGRLAPAGVVLSVPTRQDAAPAVTVVQRLRELYPGLLVFVGGGAATAETVEGILLPPSVVQAAHHVAVKLRPRADTGAPARINAP